jgi:hypothetical protein
MQLHVQGYWVEPFCLNGAGRWTRSFCYVDDLV